MSHVYLDASAIIYFVEAESPFHAAAVQSIARFRGDPKSCLITSHLTRLECRVKPLRDSNEPLLAKYDDFFRRRRLVVADVSTPVLELATDLRVRYRFKTPDAIHLATAIEHHADLFLSGDEDLQRCTERSSCSGREWSKPAGSQSRRSRSMKVGLLACSSLSTSAAVGNSRRREDRRASR